MALWQFVSFAVLMGGLLAYASLIVRRLRGTDVRLSRIEEALLARKTSVVSEPPQVAAARPEVLSAQAASDTQQSAEVQQSSSPRYDTGAQRGQKSFLTIRDLRSRSEQLRSRGTRGDIPDYIAIGSENRMSPASRKVREAHATSSESLPPLNVDAMKEDSAAASFETHEAPVMSAESLTVPSVASVTEDSAIAFVLREALATSNEQLALPMAGAVEEPPAITSLESLEPSPKSPETLTLPTTETANDDFAATSNGHQRPRSSSPPGEAVAAKKKRDSELFLNNQRRRRRSRTGY